MKQIRPSIDELKRRYSRMLAQRKMIERRHAEHPELANRKPIPDNSEPWLPHKPRSLAECIWVSDQITKHISEWKQHFQPTDSSQS